MRLFEVADRFVDDLETLLRNVVGRGDSKHAPQTLTYPALSSLLLNMGYGPLSYDNFNAIHTANPAIQSLVRTFDDQGIVLGTKEESKAEKASEPLKTNIGAKTVDQMAHRAVKRGFN